MSTWFLFWIKVGPVHSRLHRNSKLKKKKTISVCFKKTWHGFLPRWLGSVCFPFWNWKMWLIKKEFESRLTRWVCWRRSAALLIERIHIERLWSAAWFLSTQEERCQTGEALGRQLLAGTARPKVHSRISCWIIAVWPWNGWVVTSGGGQVVFSSDAR